jgi:hypothetical protein
MIVMQNISLIVPHPSILLARLTHAACDVPGQPLISSLGYLGSSGETKFWPLSLSVTSLISVNSFQPHNALLRRQPVPFTPPTGRAAVERVSSVRSGRARESFVEHHLRSSYAVILFV